MKRKNVIKNILMIAALGIAIMFFTNVIFAANNAKVSVETANLRETADEDSRILVQLSLNDEVEVLQKSGNWYQVKTKNGTTGYLREDLVKVSGEVEETQNTSEDTNSTERNTTQSNVVESNTAETNTSESSNTVESNTETTENQGQETTDVSTESGTRIVKEDTKLKIVPAINATDIVEVKQNDEVTIIESLGDWICIESGATKGWIRSDKLMTVEEKTKQDEDAKAAEEAAKQEEENKQQEQAQTTKIMYVNSATVNVRKEASKDSDVIEKIKLNTEVSVLSEENGWSKVSVNGKEGYVASNLLSKSKTQETTSRGSTTTRREAEKNNKEETTTTVASGKGSTVVETAKSYIGSRYVYGASGPNSFDCSGFTSYVFKLHGVSLNRTAKAQYSNGTAVSRSDLQPGDLVMFGPSASGINHVGIYIGGGQIVHAANPSRGVTIDTINSGYYNNNYVGARRVI